MLIKLVCLVIICFVFSHASASPLSAQVVINEFLPDPTEAGDPTEWIELFNMSDVVVSLEGWRLDDDENTHQGYVFGQTTIPAKEFLVIEKNISKIALNNSSDLVRLYDMQENLVDSVSYANIPTGKSYSRIPDGSNNWQITSLTKGTANNSTNESTGHQDTSSIRDAQIEITEIMPCPSQGKSEWIEVLSTTDYLGGLASWKIVDAANNTHQLSGSISAGKYKVIELNNPILNNAGDSLMLFNGDELKQTIHYQDCSTDHSLIKVDGTWRQTTTPTRGNPNQFNPSITHNPSPTDSPNKSNGTAVKITSKQTVTPTISLNPPQLVTIETENSNGLSTRDYTTSVAGIQSLATGSAAMPSSSSAATRKTGQNQPKPWLLVGGMLIALTAGIAPALRNILQNHEII